VLTSLLLMRRYSVGKVLWTFMIASVEKNLSTSLASRNQHRFAINVCVRILGVQLLWPVVLLNRLADTANRRCLVNDLLVMSVHAPRHQRQHVWLMHEGIPAHFLSIVWWNLSHTLGEGSIWSERLDSWPARSPDFIIWISGYRDTWRYLFIHSR
jgi:hypothetical protein